MWPFKKKRLDVGVKELREFVTPPQYATERSACADIRAYLWEGMTIKLYDPTNKEYHTIVSNCEITLPPRWRALIPTGFALDIPDGHSVRTHPRSGLSAKEALTVICGEGVIDEDYQNELLVPLVNLSDIHVQVTHNERIAQAELVKDLRCTWTFVTNLSDKNSSRKGGFGHTGSA